MNKKSIQYPLWFWLVLGAAILLRAQAMIALPDAQGDVNLFILAAEHWAESGHLSIGFKNHFTPELVKFGLNEPLSQHLPLWPMMGGVPKKILPFLDTYRIFQGLSFLFGCLLIFLVYELGKQAYHPWINFCGCTLCASCPLLVEYSANGSLYIFMACQWLILFLLLPDLDRERLLPWLKVGLLLGLSLLTHFPQTLMVLLFFLYSIFNYRKVSIQGFCIALLCLIILGSIGAIRNFLLFHDPFYSTTLNNFLRKWGLLETNLQEGRLVQISKGFFRKGMLSGYFKAFPLNLLQFMKMLAFITLLWPLGIALYGGWRNFIQKQKRNPIQWFALSLCILYLLEVSFWGFIRPRFLVPLLPLVFLWTGTGFSVLENQKRLSIRTGLALVFLTVLVFIVLGRIQQQKDTGRSDQIASKALSRWLETQPKGTILGYSELLDGGIEAIRFHHQPYVHGRNFLYHTEPTLALLHQYQPRYLWCDSQSRTFLEQLIPTRLVKREGHLCILENLAH